MPKVILTYFDYDGGRGEAARLAMHLGGIAFEDRRIPGKDWPALRDTMPFQALPVLASHGLLWPFGWPGAECVRCGFPFDEEEAWLWAHSQHWLLYLKWHLRHHDLPKCPRCGADMVWGPWSGSHVVGTIMKASRELTRSCHETADALRRVLSAADQVSGGRETALTEAVPVELRTIEHCSDLTCRTHQACIDFLRHGGGARMASLRRQLSDLIQLVQ